MGEKSVRAGRAVGLLDGLGERLEGLLAGLDGLDAAGVLTPAVEARVSALASKVSLYLASVHELVDPTPTSLLRVKRKIKMAAVAMLSAGVSEDGICSTFSDLLDHTVQAFPDDQRLRLGPTVGAAIEEALLEAAAV